MNERERTLALADAARLAANDAVRFGDEFREQRIRRGIAQADVARLVGVSRCLVWRVEHGDARVQLEARAKCARAVGATLRLSFYPGATPLIHDAAQTRIGERLLVLAGPAWRPTVEARVPGPGHRSVDVRLDGSQDLVLFEIESHVRRWEEILRELAGKRAAFEEAGETRRIHVVLVLPPSRHHHELVAALPATVRAALPVPWAELRRTLVDGGRWPGDGILWVAGGRVGRGPASGSAIRRSIAA